MTTYSNAISVFLSYAHEDELLRNELMKHLSSLERQGLISAWFDRKIAPGTDWARAIDERLDRASIILLLVSSDFLASDYCYQVEMKRALARDQAGKARVIPVILRPTDWKGALFSHLQVLPTDARAITAWSNRDEAFVDMVSGIRRAIEDLALLPASSARAALPSIWNIPYPRNPFFIGRDEVLSQLHTQLQTGQTMALSQSPTAISGLGGLAKRSLPQSTPNAPGGHILLTTRAWDMQRLATRMEVETLSDEQGAALLLRRAGLLAPDADLLQASPEDQQLAVSITHTLGGLPLALDQARAYLEATGMGLQEYQELYQVYRQTLLHERRSRILDHPEPVATTWSLSFRCVQEKNPAAADLLRLCAYFAPDAIAEEILTADASVLGPVLTPLASNIFLRNQAIEALRAYSLVRRDPREQTLSVHRLVQVVLQNELDEEEQRTWAERALLLINAAFPDSKHGTWSQCERLLMQAITGTQIIQKYQIITFEASRLLYAVASYFQDRARYREAEPLYQRALHILEQDMGPEDPFVAATLDGLASLYCAQGKYREAEPLYQRALHTLEQSLGLEHPDVTSTLNNLAILYREQGKYGEAKPLYQRALHIVEQSLGSEHPRAQMISENYTNLLQKMEPHTSPEE